MYPLETFKAYRIAVINHGKTPTYIRSYEVQHGVRRTNEDAVALNNIIPVPINRLIGLGRHYIGDRFRMDTMFSQYADAHPLDTGVIKILIFYDDVVLPKGERGHTASFVYRYDQLTDNIERAPELENSEEAYDQINRENTQLG